MKRSVIMDQATDVFVTASYGEICQEKKQKKRATPVECPVLENIIVG